MKKKNLIRGEIRPIVIVWGVKSRWTFVKGARRQNRLFRVLKWISSFCTLIRMWTYDDKLCCTAGKQSPEVKFVLICAHKIQQTYLISWDFILNSWQTFHVRSVHGFLSLSILLLRTI
jgi:hypothetical protein